MTNVLNKLGWLLFALFGAACLAVVALQRGEPVNAIWLVSAAVAVLLIAYRFYGRFIADTALSQGAGLMVMGAYGHNRLREFVLGGATRAMLEGVTLPTLMSH